MVVFQGRDSGNYKVADQEIAISSYQNYFRKLDIFFSGKQQGAIRTDRKICLLLSFLQSRIFKVGTSLSVFLTTGPTLTQYTSDINLIISFGNHTYSNRAYYRVSSINVKEISAFFFKINVFFQRCFNEKYTFFQPISKIIT